MYKLFMAFRYLRAHKIIYFTIVGVAFGILTMVVVTSLMGGFSRDMRARIRGMQTDIVVVSADKSLWITDYDSICAEIRKIPGVVGVSPRVEYEAWLGRMGTYSDVHVVGIVPETEKDVSDLPKFFDKGHKQKFNLQEDGGLPTRNPGVVIGAEMRASGQVGLLTARHSTTPVLCVKDFDVVGRFRSGMVEYDSNFIFMDIAAAQEFLQIADPPRANVIAVKLRSYEQDASAVRTRIMDIFHARRPCMDPKEHGAVPSYFGNAGFRCGLYRTMTWEQSKRVLLQAVEVEKGMQFILLFLIVIVAGFNIIAIYTLVVKAKTRDIGILRALGGTGGGVMLIFLMSGGLCGLFGSIVGIVLGLTLSIKLNDIADFIRVVSRGVNFVSLDPERALNFVPRGATWVASIIVLGALACLVWTWLVLYQERISHPWGRMLATGVLLAGAAYFSTSWLPSYQRVDHYDPNLSQGARWPFVALAAVIWAAFCVTWRWLDRYRRRPAWIFFGFAATIFMTALMIALSGMLNIDLWICVLRPDFDWPGLELFDRRVYYLDRIPVFVDYGTITTIVVMTLIVSLICSIYPALRAASADPVEALRDE